MSSNSCRGPEVERYQHFIEGANHALKILKTVKHTGMRGANMELDILFHRSDPMPLQGTHGHPHPFTTARKPDVGVTSLRTALRIADCETQGETWDTIAFGLAALQPLTKFRWYELLSSVELKVITAILAIVISPKTKCQMLPPVPPQTMPDMLSDSRKRDASSAMELSAHSAKRPRIDRV